MFSPLQHVHSCCGGHTRSLKSMGTAFCLELNCPGREFYDSLLYNTRVLEQ